MKKRKKFKIIFAARDLGGFNTIVPIIKELKTNKKFNFKIILEGISRKIAQRAKINYRDGSHLTDKVLFQLLRKEAPDLIFAATSSGKSIEKRITRIARIQRIKTCAIIDFWGNYQVRFSNEDRNNLKYLPDYLLAIDESMKKGMITEGIPKKKIFITGNPLFDTFTKLRKYKEKENLITFFCQPFSELFKKGSKGYLGFDEIQVLEDLVKALEKFQPRVSLIIKLHPRTKKLNKFDKIIKNSRLRQPASPELQRGEGFGLRPTKSPSADEVGGQAKLDISIGKKWSTEKLIEKSKLIIGMGSMVLFQAVLMGKTVLSYQPNLKKADYLISNRLGLSKAVYKRKNLYPALKKILSTNPSKRNSKLIKKYTQNNSTKKVIKFITNLLENEA